MIRPAGPESTNRPPAASTRSTRQGWRISAPASRAAATSASRTVRARPVSGKSFPVSSRTRRTPRSSKNARVLATGKRRSTLRTAAGVEPLKSRSSTASWVTLQRPPPEIRILAPSRDAPSTTPIESAAPEARAARPAAIAAINPAAPAPATTRSNEPSGLLVGVLGLRVDRDPGELGNPRAQRDLETVGGGMRLGERRPRGEEAMTREVQPARDPAQQQIVDAGRPDQPPRDLADALLDRRARVGVERIRARRLLVLELEVDVDAAHAAHLGEDPRLDAVGHRVRLGEGHPAGELDVEIGLLSVAVLTQRDVV